MESRPTEIYFQQIGALASLGRENICPFWGLATIGIELPIKQTLRLLVVCSLLQS
jgi:hypothetical protein